MFFKLQYVKIKTAKLKVVKIDKEIFKLHYVKIEAFKKTTSLYQLYQFKLQYVKIDTRKITLFKQLSNKNITQFIIKCYYCSVFL